MSLVGVEGYNNLRKDTTSGGVVNVDKNAYENYKAQRTAVLKNIQQQNSTQEAVATLQGEINNIKGDLVDIRTLLLQLIQKGK